MNLDQLSFRPAQSQDIPRVVSLINSAYQSESGKRDWTAEADLLDGERTDGKEMARLMAVEGSMILLAEIDGEPVASAHLEKHEEGAYLGMLAVSPSWQGRGIGRRLLAVAEAMAAREWGAGKMLMTVITLREGLIDFYGRFGYVRTGRVLPFQPFLSPEKLGTLKLPDLLLEYLEKPLGEYHQRTG